MFEGFSNATVDFLWSLRFNNDKTWFEAHKQDYVNYLQRPMQQLAQEVYDAIHAKYPHTDLTCRVCRIYRDARRLFGRGPYKEGLWFTLERSIEEWARNPVFWFEVKPEGYSYGMGYYSATPLTMAKFRARIDRDPKEMERLARAFSKQSVFQLEGEEYKRPKGSASALLAPWYNRKNFSLIHSAPYDALFSSPALSAQLIDGFSFLMPYYEYVLSLEGDPDPRQQEKMSV
ncbi:MAG: DUF2461 domain-containing protein [Oscillospiraceae bacterium]|nr:DUF2461 domain-containing protein [Oscillospiraceae bacterium]